jgi:TonB family protein
MQGRMIDLKPSPLQMEPRAPRPPQPVQRQQRLMIVALALLLMALGSVLYRDRDFWFPDAGEADQIQQAAPVNATAAAQSTAAPAVVRKLRAQDPHHKNSIPVAETPVAPVTISARTVLPPLEVEVVAAGTRRMVRPGSNSVRIETDDGSGPAKTAPASEEAAAAVTTNAAERVAVSRETSDVVAQSVTPGYPMLARQMKVQGSVILQALIGRDGLIQDLHILSGPPILAKAAEEAVRQWHFKPHYQNGAAVETQTRITVNFTISTN